MKTTENVAIQYQVTAGREQRIETRGKEFKSEKAMNTWIAKQERDNPRWLGVTAWSLPAADDDEDEYPSQEWFDDLEAS